VPGNRRNPIADRSFNGRAVGFGFQVVDVYANYNRPVSVKTKRFYVALGQQPNVS
jgi:hypothetical protein